MKLLKNKKASLMTFLNTAFIWALIGAVTYFLFLGGGGAKAIWGIGSAVGSIPSFAWVIIIVFILLIWLKKK
jgi:hypothetical protein